MHTKMQLKYHVELVHENNTIENCYDNENTNYGWCGVCNRTVLYRFGEKLMTLKFVIIFREINFTKFFGKLIFMELL